MNKPTYTANWTAINAKRRSINGLRLRHVIKPSLILLGSSSLLLYSLFYFLHHFIVKCSTVCIAIINVFLCMTYLYCTPRYESTTLYRAVQWHYIEKLSNDTVPNHTSITTNHQALFIYNRTKIAGWFPVFPLKKCASARLAQSH